MTELFWPAEIITHEANICSTISHSDRIRRLKKLSWMEVLDVRKKESALATALIIVASAMWFAQSIQAPRYHLPPKEIIDAFEAPPLPQAILSPSRQVMALLYRRANPTIAELARPMLRLAGVRIDPRTNGPHLTARIFAITLKKISDGSEVKVAAPPQANLSNVHFSPDGTHISFLDAKDNGLEMWCAVIT